MNFQVANTRDGYVVEAYIPDGSTFYWKPMMNFGDRQGDALETARIDCPEMAESRVRGFIKLYDKTRIYKRIKPGAYRAEKTSNNEKGNS